MTDFDKLNSATKYPSIPTYHTIEGKGVLNEETVPFEGDVIFTEKVDGTNGRIVLLPNNDYAIGSREDLLFAYGDRLFTPTLGIVRALRPLAEALREYDACKADHITTFYLEVYGYKTSSASKIYASGTTVGYRLFDVSLAPLDVLERDREKISSWRESGGQAWAQEATLLRLCDELSVPLVPRLTRLSGESLPTGEGSLEGMYELLEHHLPKTLVALDDGARVEHPEGVVLRTLDRSTIAKARFEDYQRTFRKR